MDETVVVEPHKSGKSDDNQQIRRGHLVWKVNLKQARRDCEQRVASDYAERLIARKSPEGQAGVMRLGDGSRQSKKLRLLVHDEYAVQKPDRSREMDTQGVSGHPVNAITNMG